MKEVAKAAVLRKRDSEIVNRSENSRFEGTPQIKKIRGLAERGKSRN
jgi:hypothetical protein